MNRDTKIAFSLFILCLLIMLVLASYGYDRWQALP